MKIPRKYDLKGLSVHLIVGGPVPPVLEAHGQNLGLSAMWTVGGCGRSGGRHTLMLHLFLNSHPAVPPLLQATSIPASPAASPEQRTKCVVQGMPAGEWQGFSSTPGRMQQKNLPHPKLWMNSVMGEKEVGAECCKEADMALHSECTVSLSWGS